MDCPWSQNKNSKRNRSNKYINAMKIHGKMVFYYLRSRPPKLKFACQQKELHYISLQSRKEFFFVFCLALHTLSHSSPASWWKFTASNSTQIQRELDLVWITPKTLQIRRSILRGGSKFEIYLTKTFPLTSSGVRREISLTQLLEKTSNHLYPPASGNNYNGWETEKFDWWALFWNIEAWGFIPCLLN